MQRNLSMLCLMIPSLGRRLCHEDQGMFTCRTSASNINSWLKYFSTKVKDIYVVNSFVYMFFHIWQISKIEYFLVWWWSVLPYQFIIISKTLFRYDSPHKKLKFNRYFYEIDISISVNKAMFFRWQYYP